MAWWALTATWTDKNCWSLVVFKMYGIALLPKVVLLTFPHGCCWEPFYIFASCRLVVEIQPLSCKKMRMVAPQTRGQPCPWFFHAGSSGVSWWTPSGGCPFPIFERPQKGSHQKRHMARRLAHAGLSTLAFSCWFSHDQSSHKN